MALTKVSGSVLKNPLSLSGNVSVGGTLTYEDVTNVDAIGIITARSGINVTGGTSTFSGNIVPSSNSAIDIGTNSVRFANIYGDALYGVIQNTTHTNITRVGTLSQLAVSGTANPLNVTHTSANCVNLNRGGKSIGIDVNYGGSDTHSLLALSSGMDLRFKLGGADRINFKSAGHIEPVTDSQINLGSNTVRFANVYADTLYGDGSNLTGITQTTINGNTDDYIITASGTANTLNGESNLIFTGSRLGINPSGGTITDIPATSHDTVVIGNSSATAGGITLEGSSSSGNLAFQMYKQGGQPCARFMYEYSSNSVRFDSATGGSPGSGEALRMRLHPDGDVEIADGDLIIGTSGHGIDFGATTNGGTGTPNEIFDDYEEGSWTPSIEGLSNTPSYHNLGGTYTKIGNRVFIQCHIQINGSNKPTFTSQTAAFKISGLPFTGQSTNGTGYFGAHGVCVWQQLQWVGGAYSSYGHGDDTQLSPGIVDGGTRISLQTCGQGIYYTGQLLNRALHNNYAPNIEFDMNYRTAT